MFNMRINKVVLVTGVSGAGKTSAMAVLEDMGYHCIDRFPADLLPSLIKLVNDDQRAIVENYAFSVSAQDFHEFRIAFENIECDLTILHLDATYESLLLRYKHNRRNHPLLVSKNANSLEEAIIMEIEGFDNVREQATIIIDTSLLSVQDLSKRIQEVFSFTTKQSLTISIVSFGFSKGVPRDADLVFDVRFLVNPYWEMNLRAKSGNNREVYDYVINDAKTQDYLERLLSFLDYSIEQYNKERKHHLTIAVGCTGGQHRSVSIANYLYRRYYDKYTVFVSHRDVIEDQL